MRSSRVLIYCSLTLWAAVGCRPIGRTPLPERLSDDTQERVTEAWDSALRPVDRLDRQALLDVLIFFRAYQNGVDRLHFRSEKDISAGVVVMEIRYDRSVPADDRFEVSVKDTAGKVIRQIAYGRAEVEATYRDLNDKKFAGDAVPKGVDLGPEDQKKPDEVQARLKAIESHFPKPPEDKK